jgi:phage shock protein C
MNTSAPSSQAAQSTQATKTLSRSKHNRMLAGVASGVAQYLGVDTTLVRIAFVLVTFVGGLGIPLYLASWLLIPDEDATHSIAADFTSSVQEWRN